jgi:hypothetical protein
MFYFVVAWEPGGSPRALSRHESMDDAWTALGRWREAGYWLTHIARPWSCSLTR